MASSTESTSVNPRLPREWEQVLIALAGASSALEVARVLIRAVELGWADSMVVGRHVAYQQRFVELASSSPSASAVAHPLADISDRLEGSPVTTWETGCAHRLEYEGKVVGLLAWEGLHQPDRLEAMVPVAAAALGRALAADRDRQDSLVLSELGPLIEDGLLAVNLNGRLLQYNQALQDLVGWTPEEIQRHGWTNLVYPDPRVRAQMEKGIASLLRGHRAHQVRRTMTRRDGTTIDLAVSSFVAPDPTGGAPLLVGVLQDHSVDEEARKQTIRDASMERLGRLAGGIAHDFNNLLGAVMGHAELLQMAVGNDEMWQYHTRTIIDASKKGAGLARQLLAFSGLSQHSTKALSPVLETKAAIRITSGSLPQGVRIRFDEPADIPSIEADSAQLHQVLLNLLTNAKDALLKLSSGKIEVSVSRVSLPTQGLQCRSPVAPDPGTQVVEITVQDSGPGFSPDAMANLFKPFFTTKPEGHGIGLAAVRSMMNSMGGAMRVENDGGAVIRCYFPISDRPEIAFEESISTSPGQNQVIWVVDDQTALLEYVKISLRGRGYHVHGFPIQKDLLRHMQRRTEHAPDLLLLDVMMPEGSGFELLQTIRSEEILCPVVWMSGFDPDSVDRPRAETGDFLQKPFTHSELVSVVNEALSR